MAPHRATLVRASLLCAALSFAACAPSQVPTDPKWHDGADLLTNKQEIIGGSLDSQDPAVVALIAVQNGSFAPFCTGTLIAPQTVLTAAHCVYAYGTSGFTYKVAFGSDAYSPTFTKNVASWIQYPNYNTQDLTGDLSVIKLDSPVTTVTPIPINTTALTLSDIGKNIRHAGYGVYGFSGTQGLDDGQKRQVSYGVRDVYVSQLESGADNPTRQTCSGDSGGPGFMITAGSTSERVAGIVSYGDQQCAQQGVDTRVDYYASWIQQTFNGWEQPQCTWDNKCKAGCVPVDPDCACVQDGQCTTACTDLSKDPDCPPNCGSDGVCSSGVCPAKDVDCHDVGETCSGAAQCQSRQCVSDPQHSSFYCSQTCTSNTQCPSTMSCENGTCRFLQKPAKLPFDACNANTDFCADGTSCVAKNAGDVTTCQYPCQTGDTCNIAAQTCVTGVNNVKFCQYPNSAPPARATKVLPRAVEEAPAAASCSSTGGNSAVMFLILLLPVFLQRRKKAKALAAALLTVGALSACAPADDAETGSDTVGTNQSAIVGGSVDTGDPNVFMLFMYYSNGQSAGCSGTLIAPRTILTAAHCVDPAMGNSSSVDIWVTNLTYANTATSSQAFHANPQKTTYHPGWNPSVSLSNDIALMQLDTAPGVTPKAWNSTSVSGLLGQALRTVGYGTTGPADQTSAGTKRQVALTFRAIDSDHIYLGDQTGKGVCHGDSGGPSFHTFPDGVERVVGVHSYTTTDACTDGADIRVDYFTTWINQWLAQNEGPQCAKDGACKSGCTPVDQDCVCVSDGVCSAQCTNPSDDPDCPIHCGADGICQASGCATPDSDCKADGAACASAAECPGGQCVTDPQHTYLYCSRGCTDTLECPTSMTCSNGVCRFQQLPTLAPNALCRVGQTFCSAANICDGPAGGATRCVPSCQNTSDCPSNVPCVDGVNGKYCQIAPPQPIILPRATAEGAAPAGCSAVGGAPLFGLIALIGAMRKRRNQARVERA